MLDLGWFFFIAFAQLACHELDAVAQSEGRLLPVLNQLGDEVALRFFGVAHVPLFALLMWGTASTDTRVRLRAQLATDAFLIFHALLHFAMRHHELYSFDSWVSQLCIFGGGAVGLVHGAWATKASRS